MFERSDLKVLKSRIKEPRKFIQVLTGPRQVGKTTMISQLIRQVDAQFIYEAADNIPAGNSQWVYQIWEIARYRLKESGNDNVVLVIDEIQKISDWSETVKKLWDEDSFRQINLKVILLGSSNMLLQKGLTESLAGRFEIIAVTHWSFTEMNEAFGFDQNTYAWFGGYPGSVEFTRDEARWKKYIRESLIETTISKDILLQTRIDKPALLRSLFEISCIYSGQILSYTKMLGQLLDAGNTTTLAHYLRLLATAGLVTGLEKYSGSIIHQRNTSPKFQVYNTALISAQSSGSFQEIMAKPAEWGRVVESVIGSHLINYSIRENYSVFYWRERNDEVDFILYKQNKAIAIEVKSAFLRNKTGMDAFVRRYNPSKVFLIDNNVFPWYEFLKVNPASLF